MEEHAPRVDNGEYANHNDEADENQVVDGRGAVSEQLAQFRAIERGIRVAAVQIDRENDEHAQQQEERHGLEKCVDDHHHFVSQCCSDDAKYLHGQEHRETCNRHPLIDVGVGQGHESVSLEERLVHLTGEVWMCTYHANSSHGNHVENKRIFEDRLANWFGRYSLLELVNKGSINQCNNDHRTSG